jgi:hypothetical protein
MVVEYPPPNGGVRPYNDASMIRLGHRAGMPRGEFEARVVKTADGGMLLYVRYIGGAS